ncbi:UNVERIFIED_ORG: hypothetical protein ABIB13_002231 [Arthrobacter sp. UYEF2]
MQTWLQNRWIFARLALKLVVFPQCSHVTSRRPAALRQATEQNLACSRVPAAVKSFRQCSQDSVRRVVAARRQVMEQNLALRCCATLVPFAGMVCPHISQLLPAKTLVRGIASAYQQPPPDRPPGGGRLGVSMGEGLQEGGVTSMRA